jgi:hypothetical protein
MQLVLQEIDDHVPERFGVGAIYHDGATARVAHNTAYIAQVREWFIHRLKPVASCASSAWISGVARTHLLRVEEWMLHERNFTVRTGRYGLPAHSALHTVQLGEACLVKGVLLSSLVFHVCEGASGINQVVASYAAKAFLVVPLIQRY